MDESGSFIKFGLDSEIDIEKKMLDATTKVTGLNEFPNIELLKMRFPQNFEYRENDLLKASFSHTSKSSSVVLNMTQLQNVIPSYLRGDISNNNSMHLGDKGFANTQYYSNLLENSINKSSDSSVTDNHVVMKFEDISGIDSKSGEKPVFTFADSEEDSVIHKMVNKMKDKNKENLGPKSIVENKNLLQKDKNINSEVVKGKSGNTTLSLIPDHLGKH